MACTKRDGSGQHRRLVGQRDAGIDVEHVRAGFDLGDRIGFDPAEVAVLHLLGQQLAPGRIDSFADHHEGAFEADHHLPCRRADNGVGHAVLLFVGFVFVEFLECGKDLAVDDCTRHHIGLPAAVVGEQAESIAAVLVFDRIGRRLRGGAEISVDRPALSPPLGDFFVGRVDLGLALGAIDGPLELAAEHHLMPVAALLGVDLGRDVAPVDDDQFAVAAARAGHHATRRDSVTATASTTAVEKGSRPTWRCSNSSPRRCGCGPADVDEVGIGRLRDQHHSPVVTEVHVSQLRVPVESEALPEQWFEVFGQEVGEEQRAQLLCVHRRELLGPAEELVAVRTRQPSHARVTLEQCVESAACAAVGVGDEHGSMLSGGLVEQRFELRNDSLRAVVQVGGQVRDLDGTGQVLSSQHGAEFRDQCSTGNDERRDSHADWSECHATDGPGGSAFNRSRRDLTNVLAVSAATAASRQ